jgi:5-methyltetrahydropteroyltriglutamate--homocysteine methyltransferase
MALGQQRILTTHVGSLHRPDDLVELIDAREHGNSPELDVFHARVKSAVYDITRQQVETGIDIVSDGEQGKPGYVTYIKDRLTGFEGEHRRPVNATATARDFPEYTQRQAGQGSTSAILYRPACNGPIAWKDFYSVIRDIENFRSAVDAQHPVAAFMTAASPGVVPLFLGNDYYPDEDAFKLALTAVLEDEYEAIVAAGFILQIDCPDLAMGRNFTEMTTEEFRKLVARNIELVNEATRNIPPEQMRIHLCWGNSEGPHHLDIPIRDILDLVLQARPSGISFEAANPRHAHEWAVWAEFKIPEDKVLIPGVIDTTTNFVEHPELVAQRIKSYTNIVGRDRVIASTDCGLGTWAGWSQVDRRVAWAKLKSMVEGAAIATRELWP